MNRKDLNHQFKDLGFIVTRNFENELVTIFRSKGCWINGCGYIVKIKLMRSQILFRFQGAGINKEIPYHYALFYRFSSVKSFLIYAINQVCIDMKIEATSIVLGKGDKKQTITSIT